ncbi:MAG: SLBB domain-containing protein [Phormidesmis sp.]
MPSLSLQRFKIATISSLFIVSGLMVPRAKAQSSDNALPTISPQSIPSTSVSPQVVPSAPVSESAYTLGAGDIVNIDIFRVDQYSGESQVLIDGTLNLPLVGKVNVNGLTLEAASDVLSQRYGQYLRRPLITMSLVNRRPLQIGIAGEVSRPGSYNVEQNATQSARLSQLIETAGGITQSADLSQVQVRRPQTNGNQQIVTVNLLALIKDGDLSQDVTLRDGDAIFIPTSQVPLENSALLADASFANDLNQPINIAIIGEVYRPGPYTLQGGAARTGDAGTPGAAGSSNSPSTITRAIQVAGGIKPQADIRKVQVVRPTRAGTPQVFEADLWQLLNAGDLQQDAILQEGDTVFVPVATALTPAEISQVASTSFSPDTIRVNVVGEVKDAGVVELPPNTPLSQGILAAGGFNNTRASRGSAELVRLKDDGTVERETIPVDFAQGINEENNPLLRNNDVIIVNRNGLASVTDALGTITSPLGGLFSIFRFFDIFN